MNLLRQQFQDCLAAAIFAFVHLINEKKIMSLRQIADALRNHCFQDFVEND
jgi:hypothetical protein